MIWLELSAEVEAEAVEPVAELFGRLGHGGVAVEEPLSESAEPGSVVIDPSRPILVKTYLPDDDESAGTTRQIEEGLWHLSQLRRISSLSVKKLAEEDWAEAWKEFFFVQRIGARTVIKPSWRDYEAAEDDVVLEIDPGMAFGTGLHPTTRMCLVACERYVQRGTRVLDLGTGSGILAIAAAKLGASSVLAMDVDPVAVDAAAKNIQLNAISERVDVRRGTLEGEQETSPGYDLVLANIIARVLVELAPRLYAATAPGGTLVASGIIDEREPEVLEALVGSGFGLTGSISEGDWRTLVCGRGDS